MTPALDEFLSAWRGHSANDAFHSMDIASLDNFGLKARLPKNLAPYPYVGDLRTARLWILMRNPSIGSNDLHQEGTSPLAELLRANLDQDFGEYPFLHLNPRIEGTDASNWWWRKRNFRKLAQQISAATGAHPDNIRKQVAGQVAILELSPYRSLGFLDALGSLPSAQLARKVLKEALEQAPETGRGFVMPWDCSPWQVHSYLGDSFLNNSRTQSFTFAMKAKCGFGETIARHVFGIG